MRTKIQIVIADDEHNLLNYLEQQLVALWEEVDIVAKVSDGKAASQAIQQLNPDIVFLDIHMPEINGIELARQFSHCCHIVFVTAYEQYAVEAFQAAAADYLLKPITTDRLQVCIERLQKKIALQQNLDLDHLARALGQFAEDKKYLQWIRASCGNTIELVAVNSVCFFRSTDKYTSVYTSDKQYIIRSSIKSLKRQLDPNAFWQVHRSTIIQVKEVKSVHKGLAGMYKIRLACSDELISVSRNFGFQFRID